MRKDILSVTMNPKLIKELTAMAKRVGVSRSRLLSAITQKSLENLKSNPSEVDRIRTEINQKN
jgi:metal-responsive CopG/Arc/MetJ family transcriptional regulator